MAARTEGQKVMFQIYLNKDRSASETLLKKVTDVGASAIIFTVDTPYRSKRTMDVRAKVPAKKIEVSRVGDTRVIGLQAGLTGMGGADLKVPNQRYARGR